MKNKQQKLPKPMRAWMLADDAELLPFSISKTKAVCRRDKLAGERVVPVLITPAMPKTKARKK